MLELDQTTEQMRRTVLTHAENRLRTGVLREVLARTG